MKKAWCNSKRRGFSTVEAMLAVAVFSLVATAFTSGMVYGPQGAVDAGERNRANALIEQSFAAVDSIRNDAWNELSFDQSSVSVDTGEWSFLGEATTDTVGDFTREITFEDVCRTSGNAISECPATYIDLNSKQVTVTISWTGRFGFPRSVTATRVMTNWEASEWQQTDWSGGDGQALLTDDTRYESDDGNVDTSTSGQVALQSTVPCKDETYPFETDSEYTYDSGSIELTGGVAQLTAAGSAPDSNTKGLWHLDESSGNFVDSSGSNNTLTRTGSVTYDTTGQFGTAVTFGSSTQYASVSDAAQTGLDITGSITVEAWINKTAFSGSDYIVDKWTGTGANRSYQFWVGNTGTVAFQLRNGALNGFATTAAGSITTGTWYHVAAVYNGSTIKIFINGVQSASAAYTGGIQNGTAQFEISRTGSSAFNGVIDEVRVSDTARYTSNFTVPTNPFGVYYSSDKPTIQPASSYDPTDVSVWFDAQETSTVAANTSIQYQLSDDDGTTWQYWNGSAWATATGSTDYNTLSTVSANIETFSVTSGKILWKAFLVSDGSDQVQLDTVTVRCAIDEAYTFDSASEYTYTSSEIELTSGQAQLVSAGAAPDSNTKGLWHLDESSGQLVDGSGNGNNLTASSGVTYDTTGEFGTALSFGSSSQYASITDAAQTGLDITGSITVEAWINKTAFSGSDYIVDKWTGTGTSRSYQFWVGNLGTVAFQLRNGASTAFATSAAGSITTGTWYHVAGVYDGSTIKIFINGVQSGSTAYTAGIQNGAAAFEISRTGTAAFNGVIDEVRVSDTARYTSNFTVASSPFGASYSSAEPTIQPATALTDQRVGSWIDMLETSTVAANTSIQYQLSDDDGTTWQYWNGSAWATATGSTDYNTLSTVSANIETFSVTSGKILWKAFLVSDGSDQVQLDTVTIRYQQDDGAAYPTSGTLTSSAFDMGSASAVEVVSWSETLPTCSTACTISVELRTAPDNSGSPDETQWTDWHGETGSGSTFTNHYGSLVSTELNDNQWVQYRVTMASDGSDTPVLSDITLYYH